MNGAEQPTSRDSRLVLSDGDQFRIGEYVISVAEVDDGPVPVRGAPAGSSGSARRGAPGPLDVDPLDDLLERTPDPSFQHPLAHVPVDVRTDDPFDTTSAPDVRRARMWISSAVSCPRRVARCPAARPRAGAISNRSRRHASPPPVRPARSTLTHCSAICFRRLVHRRFPALPGRPRHPGHPSSRARRRVGRAILLPKPLHRLRMRGRRRPPPIHPCPPRPPWRRRAGGFRRVSRRRGRGGPSIHGNDPEAALRAAGEVFRAMADGVREILISRAAIKGEMRLTQTLIRAHGNNALKFSPSADDAVISLLTQTTRLHGTAGGNARSFHRHQVA